MWRRKRLLGILGLAFALGCGETGGCDGGCAAGPPTGTFPDKAIVPGGAQVRLTETGFAFVADNLQPILETALPDGLGTCLAGSESSGALGETSYCLGECDDGTTGCQITMEIRDAAFHAEPPNVLAVDVTIDAFEFVIDAVFKPFGLDFVDCDITVSSDAFPVTVPISLYIEEPSRHLGFIVGQPEFDLANIDVGMNGTVTCEIINAILSVEFIEDLLFSAINGPVQEAVRVFAEGELCLPCDEVDGSCPPDTICGSGNFCRRLDEGGRCVGKPMGLEGEIDLATLMADFSRGDPSPLLYLLVPGEFAHVEGGGVTLGTLTGVAAEPNRCVPRTHPPAAVDVPVAVALRGNLDPDGNPYHAGVGVHESLLGRALWTAFDGGALCLQVDSSLTEYLSTTMLGMLLGSLRQLADNEDRPVFIAISPQAPPEAVIGAGTVTVDPEEPGQAVIDDPLLTLFLRDLGLHFYAFLDDRYLRVFTIVLDLELPLALVAVPDGLLPVLGDLGEAVVGIEVRNNELLAEDPAQLEALIPTLLGLLGPMLGDSLLSPIALPSFMGFDLSVNKVAGIEDTTMVAVFAGLALAEEEGAQGKRAVVAETEARLAARLPPRSARSGRIRRPSDAWPRAVLDVSGSRAGALPGHRLEYQLSVDGGAWGLFHSAPGGELRVIHPYLSRPGPHRVAVRARLPGRVFSLDRSPTVVVLPDAKPAAPEVRPQSAGPVWLLAALALLGLLGLARSRRAALLVALLAALGLALGCDDERRPAEDALGVEDAACEEPCGNGMVCVEGECVPDETAPCPGGCAVGTVCCESRHECVEIADADCTRHSCEPGFEPVLREEGAYDPATCEREGVVCGCQELPPLSLGTVGRWASVARRPGGGLVVSAYNSTYRDLMVAWTDTARLPRESEWVFLDGLPPDGAVVAGPSGPRAGVKKHGPDVGRWTSVAVAGDGTLHLVYRDEKAGALRYARGTPREEAQGYEFLLSTLDPGPDVGRWAALSLGADGVPAVAYRVDVEVEGDAHVGLRVAWAQGAAPAAPEDWTLHDVEVVSLGLPCGGDCPSGERCVLEEEGSRCVSPSRDCEGGCADDEACVEAACLKIWVPPATLPDFAPGPASGLAATRDLSGRLCVAYHDHSQGVLRYVRVTAEGPEAEPATVAGEVAEGEPPVHVGHHPAVWVDPNGDEHLAYTDVDAAQLMHLHLTAGGQEPVDDGVRRSPSGRVSENRVGASARITRDRAGRLLIVYQDQTFLDLLVGTLHQEEWSFSTVAGHESPYAGAFGTYVSALPALDGEPGDLLLVSFVYNNQTDPPSHGLDLRWR